MYFDEMSDTPMMAQYTFRDEKDAMGYAPAFRGPGMPQYANQVHVMQPMNEWATRHVDDDFARREAERISGFLQAAFEAGRKQAFKEIRQLIGVVDTTR